MAFFDEKETMRAWNDAVSYYILNIQNKEEEAAVRKLYNNANHKTILKSLIAEVDKILIEKIREYMPPIYHDALKSIKKGSNEEKLYIGLARFVHGTPMDNHTFLSIVEHQSVLNLETREGYKVIYPDGPPFNTLHKRL